MCHLFKILIPSKPPLQNLFMIETWKVNFALGCSYNHLWFNQMKQNWFSNSLTASNGHDVWVQSSMDLSTCSMWCLVAAWTWTAAAVFLYPLQLYLKHGLTLAQHWHRHHALKAAAVLAIGIAVLSCVSRNVSLIYVGVLRENPHIIRVVSWILFMLGNSGPGHDRNQVIRVFF